MAFPKLLLLFLTTTTISLCAAPNPPPRQHGAPLTRADVKMKTLSAIHDFFEYLNDLDKAQVIGQLAAELEDIPIVGKEISRIIRIALIFVPKSDPVLKAMQSGFLNIEKKMEKLTQELTSATWLTTYSQYQHAIENGWDKFLIFIETAQKAKEKKDQMSEAKIFSQFFKKAKIEESVMTLTRLLIDATVVSENLLDIMYKKIDGNVLRLKFYNNYLRSLLVKGITLTQAYYTFEGTNSDILARKAAENLYLVNFKMQSNEFKCMEEYKTYMQKDINDLVGAKREGERELKKAEAKGLADQITDLFNFKYYWFNWGVVVVKKLFWKKHKFEGFIETKFGKTTVAVVPMIAGNRTIAQKNTNKAIDDCLTQNHPCSKVFTALKGCSVEYAAIHVSSSESDKDYEEVKVEPDRDEDSHESFPDNIEYIYKGKCKRFKLIPKLEGAFVVYMKSDQDIQNFDPCKDLKCANGGKCTRLPATVIAFCQCKADYYGERCEEKASLVINEMGLQVEFLKENNNLKKPQ